jgi:hypothetical protein
MAVHKVVNQRLHLYDKRDLRARKVEYLAQNVSVDSLKLQSPLRRDSGSDGFDHDGVLVAFLVDSRLDGSKKRDETILKTKVKTVVICLVK